MRVYVVVLDEVNEANAAVVHLIYEHYPDNYKFNEYVYLLASDNDSTLEVARSIGIRGKDRIKDCGGVVFRLSQRYAGYAENEFWEWLDDTFEKIK